MSAAHHDQAWRTARELATRTRAVIVTPIDETSWDLAVELLAELLFAADLGGLPASAAWDWLQADLTTAPRTWREAAPVPLLAAARKLLDENRCGASVAVLDRLSVVPHDDWVAITSSAAAIAHQLVDD